LCVEKKKGMGPKNSFRKMVLTKIMGENICDFDSKFE
jgi:hypothetical protein